MIEFFKKYSFLFFFILLIGSCYLLFKTCSREAEYTNNLADSVLQAAVKPYLDSMKLRDDSLKLKQKALDSLALANAELEKERAVVKTIYIEREKQITVTDPDSVYNAYTSALEAFDKHTVYNKQDYEKKYVLNGVQVKKSMKLKVRNDFLEKDNDLLADQIINLQERFNVSEQRVGIMERKVNDCLKVSELKDEVIRELERRPVKVEKENNWLVIGGVAIGTAAVTYTIMQLAK